MKASYWKYPLQFKQPANTSRGSLNAHTAWIVELSHNDRIGYGEASPLKGLSIDDREDFEQHLLWCCEMVNGGLPIDALPLRAFPSLQFAFETASLMLNAPAPFQLFDNPFFAGKPIAINGLVWMNGIEQMLNEALEKASSGFDCIKFKVGALDFDEECRMLESFRKRFNAFKITVRLDANGAFLPDEALEKLKELKRFDIHSIEQPIRPKQEAHMHELCRKTPIPIALDEELIGRDPLTASDLLDQIHPQYIILKPTLIGGLKAADMWVEEARKRAIGWWATSALESNIGLNAIAQWCSTYELELPQGLGTGSLYTNNITSPLVVNEGYLQYIAPKNWHIPTTTT